ncbi:S8 family serine peptidase [Planosporangium sp. 12N6]|uniref:S8 family serine peptidase n=1 Tax=Planosporangium spinosum TaxID=3402278 RepID=UPI003CEFAFA9
MRTDRLRSRIVVGGLAAVLAGTATAAVAMSGPDVLPLRPLQQAQPPTDSYQHVLVDLPADTPIVAAGDATPSGAGVDLAVLARYQGRVDRLERGENGRVLAILTDGGSVDVTAGAAQAASATRDVPAPLRALASNPDVVDLEPVSPTTWKVTGNLPADRVSALSGLPARSDVLMQATADDTYRSSLWALENLGGTVGGYPAVFDADVDGVEANRRGTGTGVVVAVVDTGVQNNHPDLPPLWHNPNEICGNGIDDDHNGYVDDCEGWDFVHNDNTVYDPADSNDHGTHVAGTIAAIPNNGQGTAGLAPGATIMSVKVSANGSMWMSDVARGIRYAADNGAKVVNASLGTTPGAVPRSGVRDLEDAIVYAGSKGVIVVAAAGNDATNTDTAPQWPADLPLDNIVSVGASTAADQVAGFSNYGATSVDLFAPGHYIISTVPGGYAAMQGTSMASPHVAAAAALVMSADPGLAPAAVRQRLMDTADPVPAYQGKSITGARLNADRALAASGITVDAAAFNDFTADTPHTGTVTVKAAPGAVPAGTAVTPRATLLTNIGGTTYAVLDQPVTVNGAEITTDSGGQFLLGPESGVAGADPTLTGVGIRASVGATLPAGDYALVVDLVAVADSGYAYGTSNAVVFTVGGATAAPTPAAPTPAPATTAPGGGTPRPGTTTPVTTSPRPGTPTPTAPRTTPGPGVTPGPGTQPTSGPRPTTGPTPAPGTSPQPGTGTSPQPGTGTSPQPGTGTSPQPGTGPSPSTGTVPAPGTTPKPTAAPQPGATPTARPTVPGPVPTAPGPTQTAAPAPAPAPSPVTGNGITITSVTPANGPAGGGTTVMIIGSGFPASPVVKIGGVGAYVSSRGTSSLTVITPSGTAGSVVDVTVGDPSGRSVTMARAFRYDAAPGATPAPGTTPTPGASTPAATPTGTAAPTPTAPTGASRRDPLRLGSPTSRNGLKVAPVLNPPAGLWTAARCQTVQCRGVQI